MKNKIFKIMSLLSLVIVPMMVFADDFSDMSTLGALGMHLMLSLHSMGFLCLPVSLIFSSEKVAQKKIFWATFVVRAVVVLILACVSPAASMGLDVASIFIGGFIGFPTVAVVQGIKGRKTTIKGGPASVPIIPANQKCPNCGLVINNGNTFCTNCGTKAPTLAEIKSSTNTALPSGSEGKPFGASNVFGYNMTEEQMVETIIKKEIDKAGQNANVTIAGVERRKTIFAFVYAIILMICVSLYFFHSNTALLIIVFLIVTITYFCISKNYNLIKYLKKEVKSRPDEKIGYIVSTVLEGKVSGTGKFIRIAFLLVAVGVPLFIFRAPHVIYEQDPTLDGYVIRFYTIGWLENDSTLEIPAEYKGEPVVGIRGDVFANVHTLKKVVLPDTIKEIRGGAFKNASRLEEINLPEGIPEIKGETFQDCYSLKEITIPDSVTRIGGHAFRSNRSLAKVNISPNSQLVEIGSSAFRECYELEEIYLPRDVNVNEKAFKDSGTNVKEYTADGLVLEDIYDYSREVYLDKIGAVGDINTINDDAIVKEGTVELVEVTGKYGNYTFTIKCTSGGKSQTFTLYRGKETQQINNNLLITIDDDYVFDTYSNRVTVRAYYN